MSGRDVDELEAEVLGALEKLRSAGRTSHVLKGWCDDAITATRSLAALARAAVPSREEEKT